jgi:hypothetical protein
LGLSLASSILGEILTKGPLKYSEYFRGCITIPY